MSKRRAAMAPKPAPAPRAPQRQLTQSANESTAEFEARIAALEAERDAHAASLAAERANAAKAARQLDQFKRQTEEANARARDEKLRSHAIRLAADNRAHHPEDVAELLMRRITLDPSGNVVDASDATKPASEAAKAFFAERPGFIAAQVASGSGAGPVGSALPGKQPPPAPRDLTTRAGATQAVHDAIRAAATTKN